MNAQPASIEDAIVTFRKASRRLHLASLNLAHAVQAAVAPKDSSAPSIDRRAVGLVAGAVEAKAKSEALLDRACSALAGARETNADKQQNPAGLVGRDAGQAAPVISKPTAPPVSAETAKPVPVQPPTPREAALPRDAGGKAAAPASPRPSSAAPLEPGGERPALTNQQRAVYVALLRETRGATRGVLVDKSDIAKATGIHGGSVAAAFSVLKRDGYLAWQWVSGRREVTLIDPPAELVAAARAPAPVADPQDYDARRDGPARLYPVVAWLREAGDYVAWDGGAARYAIGVNYARATPLELVKRANVMRRNLALAPFDEALADRDPVRA